MPIRVLAPDVSAKIAAGEVIERPASVVKELLENSLDADATEVSIEIAGGGVEQIRVADNGAGIAGDEAELAFQRHATSKVSSTLDLETISTLGFRGEALPSIGAVSNVSLVSRTASAESGTRVDVAEGEVAGAHPEGAAPGTSVTVRHLFRNFPARRKFLRTSATEASRIQSLVTRYALAYPQVRFQLSIDGSTAFSTSGSGDLREAIADVYSPRVAHEMLELTPEPYGDGRLPAVSGMIGAPSLTRVNRSHVTIFVNGRWVQSRTLGYALEESYRGFLMERRFPIAVVHIALPYEDVDVNVHPSKTEIRFHREGLAFSALQQAVRHTLTTHSPVPEIGHRSSPEQHGAAQPAVPPTWPPAGLAGWPSETAAAASIPGSHARAEAVEPPPYAEPLVPRKALPALRVLGQSQSTYIAAEGSDGVYLIDQHAAHERVLFERVTAETLSQPPQVQGLMEPVTVELDPRQRELAESQAELIARLGFEMDGFGGQSVILRGVPHLLSGADPARSLVDVLDLMAEGGGFESWEEKAAYSIACHGAIRAGKSLSHQEMSELIRQLELCQQPHNCPHGRPTMVHMSSARLEREFGRR